MTENGLVKISGTDTVIPKDQYELVVRTVAKGLDENELGLFFYECKRRGVHPLDRMIYAIKRKDNSEEGAAARVTFQCSIDYYRAAAEDTGKYLAQEPVVFGEQMSLSKACKSGAGHDDVVVPEFATATVVRKNEEDGETMKISATAYFREYYPGERMGHMWRKMPFGQLAKCAEALALRKAFPRKLGGLYVNEEVERPTDDIPFAKDTVKPKEKPLPAPSSPAPQQPREPGQDEGEGEAPQRTFWQIPNQMDSKIKMDLYNELMNRAGGDTEIAEGLLKEASGFKGNNGLVCMSFNALEKWTDSWCSRALAKLRETGGR